MNILESIVTAVCLCADCFAVSTCSSTTLKTKPGSALIGRVAISFGIIQTALLVIGWAAGKLLFGVVNTWAHVIGGICCGNALGRRIGKWAEIIGGAVLLGMGVAMVISG